MDVVALKSVSFANVPSAEGAAEPTTEKNVEKRANPNFASLTGSLAPGVGATMLMHFFVEERTGRLVVAGIPGLQEATLFFFAGEPVHLGITDWGTAIQRRLSERGALKPAPPGIATARHPLASLARRADPVAILEALRDEVRDFGRAFLAAAAGQWSFFDDERILESMPLTAVNPFGFVLEARRRATPPEALMRLGEEISSLVPAPDGGFANVSARLKSFTCQVDLADVIDGQRRAGDVFKLVGLDPIIGGMVLQTLADTGLLQLLAHPKQLGGRVRRTAKASAAPVLLQADGKQLSQLASLPGRGGAEILALYLEIKPEHDDGATLGLEGSTGPATVERCYQQRLAELDPRAIPAGANRPYLLARVEELRTKVERAYQARRSTRARTTAAYQLLDRLGAGGMAEIVRGTATDDPTTLVAIKCIRPELRNDPKFSQMFLEEARLARRIRHPNVVRVLTVGRGSDDLYLAMEFVDGSDFGELVRQAKGQGAPPPIDVVCRIVAEACAGLHAAHTARDRSGTVTPILHRDVSPQNILVSRNGDVKLADFGIAKALDSKDDEDGAVKGKIPYLAPEMLLGQGASVRSDVYAIAMTVYAALGHFPFQRGERKLTLKAILADPLPPLSALVEGVPPLLDAILLRGAARNPDERHVSAQELQLELEVVLSERPPVDVGAWARPLAGKRNEPSAPTHTIISICSPPEVLSTPTDHAGEDVDIDAP
jgi:serine/threonine protein kinase